MHVRLAVIADAAALAGIHYGCRNRLPTSFMINLGPGFLTAYYRILLRLKTTVVLCAENEAGLLGFASGTTDMEQELASLRKYRVRLALAALPSLLIKPGLSLKMYARSRQAKVHSPGTFYVFGHGARAAFWGWAPGVASGASTIVLFKKWLELMRLLEAPAVRGEVDFENTKIAAVHAAMGAKVEKHFHTPEGKKRILIIYDLHPAQKARPST